jgi:hypothetical protein
MRYQSAVSTLFGFALLGAIGYGLFLLARLGAGFLEGIDPGLHAPGAAAALTLILCASIIANGLHSVARRDDVRRQREARAAVYEQVLRLQGPRGGPGLLTNDEQGAEQLMVLHASPAVLRAYLRLRGAHDISAAGSAPEVLAELVRAMRRDLGQRGTDVTVGELAELLAPAARPRVQVGMAT